MASLPRPKIWRYRRFLSEHAFDKLRLIDCTFGEFEAAIERAEIIEETEVHDGLKELLLVVGLKELLLVVDWTRPLHVVVVVDEVHREERVVTVYEPDRDQWSADYRGRYS